MQNLEEAVLIMVLGMGGVCAFLTLQALVIVALQRLAPADKAPDSAEALRTSLPFASTAAIPPQLAAAPVPASAPTRAVPTVGPVPAAARVPEVAMPRATASHPAIAPVPGVALAPAASVAASYGSTVAIIQAAIAAYESDQGVR